MSFILTDGSTVTAIKKSLNSAVRGDLEALANREALKGPFSVTYNPPPVGSKHDYFSEGPYWWPDPNNPGGAYIRRDGEFNPDRFMHHQADFKELYPTVVNLAYAGYYLDKREYSERALKLINTWFVDEETRMNPHLLYGQAVRGICEGRGIGIIDFRGIISIIHACGFLGDADLSGFRAWCGEFLQWLKTSEHGAQARRNKNNHSTWYNADICAIALFLGDKNTAEQCFEFYKTTLLKQISQEGEMTDELTRTNSFFYSLYNLTAFAVNCELAHHAGVDLWNYQSGGRSIKKSVLWHIPYMREPKRWKWQQISTLPVEANYALKMAKVRLGIDCDEVNEERRTTANAIDFIEPLGSFLLF